MRAIGAVFGSLGKLLSWPERFAVLAGNVKRVAELDEVLSDLEQSISTTASSGAKVEDCGSQLRIAMTGCDVVTPAGECCVSDLTVSLEHGQSLMVTGANATGKSSLGRVITGLWPLHSGKLVRPCAGGSNGLPAINEIFLVPQRVFMCTGSLADQVSYPLKLAPPESGGCREAPLAQSTEPDLLKPPWPGFAIDPSHHKELRHGQATRYRERTPADEEKLMGLLKLVGIDYLVERWEAQVEGPGSGWDHVAQWEDVSGSAIRMQRLWWYQDDIIISCCWIGAELGRATADGHGALILSRA